MQALGRNDDRRRRLHDCKRNKRDRASLTKSLRKTAVAPELAHGVCLPPRGHFGGRAQDATYGVHQDRGGTATTRRLPESRRTIAQSRQEETLSRSAATSGNCPLIHRRSSATTARRKKLPASSIMRWAKAFRACSASKGEWRPPRKHQPRTADRACSKPVPSQQNRSNSKTA
jgi:hypothetical protein